MKNYNLLIISIILSVILGCTSPVDPDKDVVGCYWKEIVGTTWYIVEGNKLGLERWVFYNDSVVADIDEFTIQNGERVVTNRKRMIAKVHTKDMHYDHYVTSNSTKVFRSTELQWKTMWPSLGDPNVWAYVFDWSVYQMWCIEWMATGTACIGDVPNCYLVTVDKPFKLTYGEGWLYDEL